MNNKKIITVNEPFVRKHRAFFVGLFVIAPLLTVPALLIFTIAKNDMLEKWCGLYAVYENSQGLKNGNQVTMSGTAIGHVKSVELVREKVVWVRFDVRGRYNHLVKKDTRARLKQKGFVGDWEIELTGGSDSVAVVRDGDTLLTENVQTMDWAIEVAVKMLDTATLLLSKFNAITEDIYAGKGAIGHFFKDETLYKHIEQIAGNTVSITTDGKKTMKDVNRTINNVNTVLLDVNKSVSDISAGGITMMDTLVNVIASVKSALDDAGYIIKDLKTMSGEAPEIMERLQYDLGQAELMMKSLQSNWFFRGITGGMSKDPDLIERP
ncbi:MAG: MlaD family protein [Chitinispirillales bacterium]|jgi:phospholipid/cholesterol/gamma-HCH transport system substrate-binding protein|nr:MlaD family protein [Chitinispirillales bacterium]